jgi:hypothetical protein
LVSAINSNEHYKIRLKAVEERNIEVREQLARFAQNQKEIKEREERLKLEEEKILLGK